MSDSDKLRKIEKQIVVLRRMRRQKRDRGEPIDHLKAEIDAAIAEAKELRHKMKRCRCKRKGCP